MIQLKHSGWLHFAENVGAIVLLAHTLGEIILPEITGGQCDMYKPVEKDHDYLAHPIYMLKGDERIRRMRDHSKGFLQVNDDYFWHSFDLRLASKPCACIHGGRCKTKSRLGRSAKENANISSHAPAVDVFETFCDGAAIISGPEALQNRAEG